MSNYQRLISYIYTYEGGIKGKNIGFAKLETRGNQCRITVSVKKIFVGGNPIGVYLLAGQDEIRIGTLFARNGAGEFRTVVHTQDVENSGYSLEDCYGLSVHDAESAWRSYTTVWEDAADAVAHAAEVELSEITAKKQRQGQGEPPKTQAVSLPISEEIEKELEREELERMGMPETQIRPKTQPRENIVRLFGEREESGFESLPKLQEEPKPREAVREMLETACETSEAVGEVPETVREAPKAVSEASETVRETPETVRNMPEAAREMPKTVSEASETVRETPETVRNMSEVRVSPEDSDKNAMQETEQPANDTALPRPEIPAESRLKMETGITPSGASQAAEASVEPGAIRRETRNQVSMRPGTSSGQVEKQEAAPVLEKKPEPSAVSSGRRLQEEKETGWNKETPAPSEPMSGTVIPFKETGDTCSEQEMWERLRKRYPKILAFDYADGCEILTIKPQDIGLLPREVWVYGNNSFLLHGYYSYRYLILARLNNPSGRARYLLGIPGHYYSNEKYMAAMFGFADFVLSKKQPPKDGRFGYWYTDIKIGD